MKAYIIPADYKSILHIRFAREGVDGEAEVDMSEELINSIINTEYEWWECQNILGNLLKSKSEETPL